MEGVMPEDLRLDSGGSGRTVSLLGLSGSLRRDSWNTALLRSAAAEAPDDTTLELFDLRDVPLYNEDRDDQVGGDDTPPGVLELRRRVAAADGLVLASPEYNWSYSSVLKTAIDWCSRPSFASVLLDVPTLLLGVSAGPAGTGRAQLHLRQVLLSTQTPVLMDSLQLPHGGERFDNAGRLTDEPTRELLRKLLATLRGAVLARPLTPAQHDAQYGRGSAAARRVA
jgi:chromate reductase